MTKKYELKDFFTKTNNETSSKMILEMDGVKTDHYFMVLGGQARGVQRAVIQAQVSYADVFEQSKSIKDKADKLEFERDGKEAVEIQLALALVTGWSFGEFNQDDFKNLLDENKGLALSIYGFANTTSNYLKKK